MAKGHKKQTSLFYYGPWVQVSSRCIILIKAHFYTPVQWLTVNSACNAEAPEDSVSQGLIEGWAQSFKFCPQRVLGQSILPRSLYSGSEEKERDEAADISLLLAAVEYPPTEYSITFLGVLTSHYRISTFPQ